MKLQDNVAVITGAGSGIGRALALAFVREGARIAVCDINVPGAHETVALIEAEGGEALAIEMDVTDEAAVDAGVAAAATRFGRIDTMIANAGIQIVHPVEDFPYADFQKVVNVHLGGGFLLTKACIKVMYPQKSGALIYMGSAHSHEASPLKSAYVAAKHGLLGLGRVMAKEGAPHGVRANVICPGFVKTPLVEKQIPEQAARLGISEDEVVRRVMLGNTVDAEFTTVEDVADVAIFLAGFGSNALTGQSITVSHGWHMS